MKQQPDSTFLLMCPDGQRAITTLELALAWLREESPSVGCEVRFIDQVGLIYKVLHLKPPRKRALQPPRAPDPEPEFRLFLQQTPSTKPYVQWGDWKVRPFAGEYLEVEASAIILGSPVFVVAYLAEAEDHSGINAVAILGEMMNLLFGQQQKILGSPEAKAALEQSGYLWPLLESDSVDDGGLGHCMLKFFDNGSGCTESMLIWTDGQPSELRPAPHTRFLVQRTFHIALGLVAELLALQQVPSMNHSPEAPTVWKEADSTLDWLDVNLSRAGRILDFLADIFQ